MIAFDRELYVVPSATPGGDGTKGNPLRAVNGNLDPLVPWFGVESRLTHTRVTLAAGLYSTAGFKVPRYFSLAGAGMDETIIRLDDNVGARNQWYPDHRMLTDGGHWSHVFECRDLTLDGNWNGQAEAQTNGHFKMDLINVQTIRGLLHRVRVTNFGANGALHPQTGWETFPIGLHTFSNGEPFNYSPEWAHLKDLEEQTFLEIVGCEAVNPHFLNGGYCTAIFVTTYAPTANRQVFGTRTSLAASIRDNYVSVPGGIAYGCARSERLDFTGNVANHCFCAFNHDTGPVKDLRIEQNQFLNCNAGVNVVAIAGSGRVSVNRNFITLTEPFWNDIMGRPEPFYWLRHGSVDLEASGNHVMKLGDPKHQMLTTLNDPWATNTFISRPPSEDLTEELAFVKARLEETKALLSQALVRGEKLDYLEDLIRRQRDATNAINAAVDG